jgi:hypothetical protein
MNDSKCIVHNPKKNGNFCPVLSGWICKDGRRHIMAYMGTSPDEYPEDIFLLSRTVLLKKHRKLTNLEDRYCWLTNRGVLHLCECYYSAEDIVNIEKRAHELAEALRMKVANPEDRVKWQPNTKNP